MDDEVGAVLVDDGGAVGYVTTEDLDGVGDDAPLSTVVRPLDELPRVDPDAPADGLANLLDRDQPYVLITPPDGDDDRTWLSSLGAIDQRIQDELRREHAGPAS